MIDATSLDEALKILDEEDEPQYECGGWRFVRHPKTKKIVRYQVFCGKCDLCLERKSTYWNQQFEQRLWEEQQIRILENMTEDETQAVITRMGKENYKRFPHDEGITLFYKEDAITTRKGQLLNENSRKLSWDDLNNGAFWLALTNKDENTRITGSLIQVSPRSPKNTIGDSFETASWSQVRISAIESAYTEAESILGELDETDHSSYQESIYSLDDMVEDILRTRKIEARKHLAHVRVKIDYKMQDSAYIKNDKCYSASENDYILPNGMDLIGLAP